MAPFAPRQEELVARPAPHVVVAWSPTKHETLAAQRKQAAALDEQKQREAQSAGDAVAALQRKEEDWWAWYRQAKAASDVAKAKEEEEAEMEKQQESIRFERTRRERLEREREEHAAMLQAARIDLERRVQAERLKEEERVRAPPLEGLAVAARVALHFWRRPRATLCVAVPSPHPPSSLNDGALLLSSLQIRNEEARERRAKMTRRASKMHVLKNIVRTTSGHLKSIPA